MKKLKVNTKLFGSISLSFAMIFTSFATYLPTTISAAEQKAVTTYQKIGKIIEASKDGNEINLTTEKEKIRLTFLEDGIFRLNMEQKDHDFLDKPVPRDKSHKAEILDKKLNDYEGSTSLNLDESDPDYFIITTDLVKLKINKNDSKMELINNENGNTLWKEKEPLMYKDDNTIQTLETDQEENFYGGGMTNGYFSHKGTSIKIEKNPNIWTDGYPASPTPFYMSSKGYGVMRYTWMEGLYDFGKEDANTVKTSHAEDRFDAFYYVEKPMDITSLIHDFTNMTGEITLLPEYAFYLGHLNCYSRDKWKEDPNGRYELGTSKKKWTETGSGSVLEKLMGEDQPSAQSMMQSYIDQDMPLGYFLPNDGYGCGYGREDTLDGNVANLKEFANYAAGKNIETGLWTQSDLTPNLSEVPYLQRDLAKEVKAGVHALKTDVAWVGAGYSMALSGVKQASDTIEANSDFRRFIVSLDGWAGTQRYAGLWSGDQTGGNWEYIRMHIPTYIGSGLSGNPNVGSDQDGIWGQNSEVSTRDYQWKTFTPIQLDMDGWANEVKHPGYYSENAGINRMYLKMKAQMMPYIYSISREATDTSKPMIRAMLLEYPNDPYTYGTATQYQYMWGPNMLVAPVYREDENTAKIRNSIYLPDDKQVWIDYFTGEQYQGGQILNNFSAPLWKTPVFIKNGAIVPMTEENNNSFEIATDATRTFEVWPSGKTSFDMYEDDGYSQEYKKSDAFAFTKITSEAPITGKGKATIKVEKPVGNYGATKHDASRATEFIINVQENPTTTDGSIKLTANGKEITGLKEVTTQAEYDSATGPVYFYNEKPNMNKYEKADSTFDTEILTTPKLYVKTAKMDVTANEIAVEIEGFNNTASAKSDGETEKPTAPTNATYTASDSKIDFAWDAAERATTYEVQFNGEDQPIVKNITDTKWTAENLKEDSEYPFSVRAVNSQGASEWTTITPVPKTELDRYRNVPKDMSIIWSGEGSEPRAYAGKLTDIIDGSDAEYSSANAGEWLNQSFTIDMKKIYSLDKIEYNFRQDKSNGAVDQFIVSYSKDGRNWKDEEWSNIKANSKLNEKGTQLMDTLVFDTPIDARYLKFTVKASSGGFLQCHEIRPYKVNDTKGYILGDYSENGELDDGDTVFMKNYMGTMDTDTVWEYTGKADQNSNGVLDGYDLSFLLSLFDGGNKPTEEELRGGLMLVPEKTSLKAGEKTLITVLGVDLNDVYGLSVQLGMSDGLKYVPNSVSLQPTTVNMENYSKLSDSNGNLMIALSNMGGTAPISGNVSVATFELEATQDIDKIKLTPMMANVISSRITEKDAKMVENTEEPTDPKPTSGQVAKKDFTVSLTNDSLTSEDETNITKLFQSNNLNALFDNSLETIAEYKWDIESNWVENTSGVKCLPEYIKLPLTMNFTFKQPKMITDFTVYNRASGNNGRVTKIKAIGYTGEEATVLGEFDEAKDEYKFTNPDSKVFDRIEIIPMESAGNVQNYTSNTNALKNGNNRMLTLREITFHESNNIPVQSVSLNKGKNVSIPVGGIKGINVLVAPSNALNKNVKVESADPGIATVVKMSDTKGNDIYMLKGVANGETTITATSNGDSTKKSTIKVKVNGVLNLDELTSFVDRAKAEKEDYYTPESWKDVADALTTAEDILVHPDNYEQKDVNKVAMDLSVALSKLKIFETNPDKHIPSSEYSAYNTLYSDSNVPENAFDGNTSTFFESPYVGENAGFPANFTIKLANDYSINQIDFVQYSTTKLHDYEIQVSMTGGDDFVTVASGTLRDITGVQEIKFPKTDARYVRLKMISGDIEDCARIAEISIYGDIYEVPATGITLDSEKADIKAGEKIQINATITPSDSTEKQITWKSSDDAIATVDENGLVTGVGEGDVTITATLGAAHLTATITIHVFSTTLLEDAIADVETFINDANNEGKYTEASWTAYKQVLKEAKDLLANTEATATEIVTMTNTLIAAKDDVLVPLVSKDELQAAIEEAEAIKNGTTADDAPYTVNSFAALQQKIREAKEILANTSATKEELANSNKALKDAIEALVTISDLRTAVTEKGTITGDFTLASKTAYDTAVANAKAMLTKADATQDQINTATNDLVSAYQGLVSLTDLKAVIERGSTIKEDTYTKDSFQVLKEALKAANKVLTKENATKAEVDTATNAVNTAITNLVALADKTDLQKVLDDYASIMKALDEYTDTTAAAFSAAYNKAKALNENAEASQVDVDQAVNALNTAAENLQKKNDPIKPSEDQIIYNQDKTMSASGSQIPVGTKFITTEKTKEEINAIKNKIKDQGYISKIHFENVWDFSIKDTNGNRVNSPLKIRIKLSKEQLNKKLQVIYIDEDGSVEVLPSYIDGMDIVFTTTHNSTYAIVSYTGAEPIPNNHVGTRSPNNITANTGDKDGFKMTLMTLLFAGIALIVCAKAKKKEA